MNGAPRSARGPSNCCGIFCNYQDFVKGLFTFSTGKNFTYEAKLLAFIIVIENAIKFNWSKLWIELDSTYMLWAFKKMSVSILWNIHRWLNIPFLTKNFIVIISNIFRDDNSSMEKVKSLASINGSNEL